MTDSEARKIHLGGFQFGDIENDVDDTTTQIIAIQNLYTVNKKVKIAPNWFKG